MEFRQLNTFITVADLNSFTRAADMLGYTQPTVTSQIQLLEIEYLLILAEEGCSYRRTIMTILSDSGLTPKSIMEIDSIQTMKQLAINGLGITLLPKITVEEELSTGQLVELNWCGPSFEFFTQVIYHEDKWMSPALQAFLNITKELLPMQHKSH